MLFFLSMHLHVGLDYRRSRTHIALRLSAAYNHKNILHKLIKNGAVMTDSSSKFSPTEQRIAVTCSRFPAFPRRSASLVRLVKGVYKRLHDDANALLRLLGINRPEYNFLMMLYKSENFTLTPVTTPMRFERCLLWP